ncbi:hypothetical protein [Nocardioides sp. B-3]|uniref:hypothetical protein n=1 Tax=Nocardioides sp. B-3 TaxID=2895565 RepID=UPI00215226D8|nr:hypothetical protein [Nocardioides sp. B-3]UUZ60640.1 hypothetical protein LP418_07370 [Nocardioides sp. B-3]
MTTTDRPAARSVSARPSVMTASRRILFRAASEWVVWWVSTPISSSFSRSAGRGLDDVDLEASVAVGPTGAGAGGWAGDQQSGGQGGECKRRG